MAKRRSIQVQSMQLMLLLLLLAAIAVTAWWSWANCLSPAVQVDTLLAIGAILSVLQCSLGPARRYSTHWFIQYGAWGAFYLPVPLVAFALTCAARIDPDMINIVVWASLTHVAAGRHTNSMAKYMLNDTLQHGMRHAQRIFHILKWFLIAVIACWDSRIRVEPENHWILIIVIMEVWGILFLTKFQHLVPHLISSHRSRKQAEYMKREARSEFFDPDATSMEKCQYPFEMRGNDGEHVTLKDVLKFPNSTEVCKRSLLGQVCLSYSLFNMIKRRHYGFPCAEQGNANVLEFVLKGFPADGNDGSGIRAFEVVELQLAFLHDNFFIFDSHIGFDLAEHYINPIMMNLQFSPTVSGASALLLLNLKDLDQSTKPVFRLKFVLVLLFLVDVHDLLQRISNRASNWREVRQVWQRHCTRDRVIGKTACIRAVLKYCQDTIDWAAACFRRHPKYWQNKIGQYSLIEDCHHTSAKKTLMAWVKRYLLDERHDGIIHHPVEMDPVSLTDIVKGAVFSAFSNSRGRVTNGVSSLQGNKASELSWTCSQLQLTHTDTIMIWHVATWYCEMIEMDYTVRKNKNYNVARDLSKYCAYLVAFLPEFFPEHSLTTMTVFQQVLIDAKRELLNANSREEKIDKMKLALQWDENGEMSTFVKGVKLGHELKLLKVKDRAGQTTEELEAKDRPRIELYLGR